MIKLKLVYLRKGQDAEHELLGLLRQSVYSRLAGCEDTNDGELYWFSVNWTNPFHS